jgi:hypothetical protein
MNYIKFMFFAAVFAKKTIFSRTAPPACVTEEKTD